MKKYDAYDNELTKYIDLVMGFNIKDIVGDIVGDILDFDMPVNLPDGSHTIEVETSTGPMTISINKLFSKNVLVFSRKIGDSIYEEYQVELETIPINFLVYGSILEKREKGVVVTNIVRCYDYLNHDDADKRLISSEEIRSIFDYNQIEKIYPNTSISNLDVESQFEALKNIKDLSHLKRVKPLIKTIVDLRIPNYIGANYRRGEFPNDHFITVNNQSRILLYEFIEGNKTLERANDLLHGNITSKSIDDLKTMIDYSRRIGSKAYLFGFNYLADVQTSTNGEIYAGRLSELESELIGSSTVNMPKYYYEYLKELLLETFDIELGDSINPKDVVKLIKNNYRRDENDES